MKEYIREDNTFTVPDFTVNTGEKDLVITIKEGYYTGVSYSYENLNMETDNMMTYNLNVLSENEIDANLAKVAENILLSVLYDTFDNLSNLTSGENDNV